jgi:hypothetical protein
VNKSKSLVNINVSQTISRVRKNVNYEFVMGNYVASELKGNTLRVYWYLFQSNKSVGPRKLQKKLAFSSPALAVYHLDKLVDLGLVKKTSGEYKLSKVVDVGVLKQFLKVGSFILPRQVLYASMFTPLFIFYLLYFREVTFHSVFAVIFGGLSTLISWYETIKAWRNIPS